MSQFSLLDCSATTYINNRYISTGKGKVMGKSSTCGCLNETLCQIVNIKAALVVFFGHLSAAEHAKNTFLASTVVE